MRLPSAMHMHVLWLPHGEFMGALQKQSQLRVAQLSANGRHMRISGPPDPSGKVRTQYCRSATQVSDPHENVIVCDPPVPPLGPLPPFGPPPAGGMPPLPPVPPSPTPATPPLGVPPVPAPPGAAPLAPPRGAPAAPAIGAPPAPPGSVPAEPPCAAAPLPPLSVRLDVWKSVGSLLPQPANARRASKVRARTGPRALHGPDRDAIASSTRLGTVHRCRAESGAEKSARAALDANHPRHSIRAIASRTGTRKAPRSP